MTQVIDLKCLTRGRLAGAVITCLALSACGLSDRDRAAYTEQAKKAVQEKTIDELRPLSNRNRCARHGKTRDEFLACRVYADVARGEIRRRVDEKLANDPYGACREIRMGHGRTEADADRLCRALSPGCVEAYIWRNFGSRKPLVAFAPLSFFSCRQATPAGQIEYAGSVFTSMSVQDVIRDKTVLSYDPCHGYQVSYRDTNDRFFLWYGESTTVVSGRYSLELSQLRNDEVEGRYCQSFDQPTFDPAMKRVSTGRQCNPIKSVLGNDVEMIDGDIFNLSTGGNVPSNLMRDRPPQFAYDFDPYIGESCTRLKAQWQALREFAGQLPQ
ncbi:MAG: hypothetical protein AAGB10_23360 [Pseudomonadota bacterium]